MVELLKQGQYQPLSVERQVAIIFAGTNGYLDDLPATSVRPFEQGFYGYLDKEYADLMHELRAKYELTDTAEQKLRKAIEAYKAEFAKAKKV
jgi:F-type H+-transporting ATPase subunit alpha